MEVVLFLYYLLLGGNKVILQKKQVFFLMSVVMMFLLNFAFNNNEYGNNFALDFIRTCFLITICSYFFQGFSFWLCFERYEVYGG